MAQRGAQAGEIVGSTCAFGNVDGHKALCKHLKLRKGGHAVQNVVGKDAHIGARFCKMRHEDQAFQHAKGVVGDKEQGAFLGDGGEVGLDCDVQGLECPLGQFLCAQAVLNLAVYLAQGIQAEQHRC